MTTSPGASRGASGKSKKSAEVSTDTLSLDLNGDVPSQQSIDPSVIYLEADDDIGMRQRRESDGSREHGSGEKRLLHGSFS